MSDYEIGISGIQAAQNALNVIGNNLANAATEGYHCQEVDLRPMDETYSDGFLIGQGVEFEGIRRLIDDLLEQEIMRQQSSLSQISRELDALTTLESAFAELSTSALSSAMDNFFNIMQDLSTNPADINTRTLVISNAESLANQFRNLGAIVADLDSSVYTEAQQKVSDINLLASRIAELNEVIHTQTVGGADMSNTLDQRDKLIADLSEIVSIKTISRDYGVVDVTLLDMPLVINSTASTFELALVANGDNYDLGLRIEDGAEYFTNVTGGELGGLFSLKNTIIRSVSNDLDELAQVIINETNKYHVQGVGLDGSFTTLTGWTMSDSAELSTYEPPVSSGSIFIRLTAPDGTVTRHEITVDASEGGDTLTTIMNKIAAISGLDDNTCINAGKLQIVADTGYSFDFLPGVLASPAATVPDPLVGAGAAADQAPPTIEISGLYSGSSNQTYTCTVSTTPAGGTPSIGSGTMVVDVQDGSGVTVATLNVGEGYVPGTSLIIGDGIEVSFGTNGTSPGYFNDGDVFTINALASSDTSGFLAAAGINCFFSGTDASSMALRSTISNSSSLIAASRSVAMDDNRNALLMAQLGETAISALGGFTPKEYYRNLTSDIGNDISSKQISMENTQGVLRSLENQRDETSGVDINEEATKMLVYERLFQAMSRYITTVSETLEYLMNSFY